MFHLPANRKTRVTFYEEECRLCMEWALGNFKSKALAIQFALAVTILCYTAARPSSVLKTTNSDDHLTLRDVEIEISRHVIDGIMVGFDVLLKFKHFKGHFYGQGKQVFYAVNTVENRGNLLLDLRCWLVYLCIVAAFGQLRIRKHFGLQPKRLWPFRRNIGTNRCFRQEQNVVAA